MHSDFDRLLKDAILYAKTGKADELVEVLDRSGIKRDYDLGDGWTLLTNAASAGRAATVRVLLDRGYDPKKATSEGESPLMHAAFRGSLDCVELLLTAGADPDQKDVEGSTALDFARRWSRQNVVLRLAGCTEDSWAKARPADLHAYDNILEAAVTSFINEAISRGERGVVQPFLANSALPEWFRRVIASVPLSGIAFLANPSAKKWEVTGGFMTMDELSMIADTDNFRSIQALGAFPIGICDGLDFWTMDVGLSHNSPVGIWDHSAQELLPVYGSFQEFLRMIVPGRT